MASEPPPPVLVTPAPVVFWSRRRILLWTALALVLMAARGREFLASINPPAEFTGDFVQDWVSARNYQTGHPVYEDTREGYRRHAGPDTPAPFLLPRNAHPPGSVVAVLPLAWLPFPNARLAWNLITLGLFVAAVGLVVWELGVRGWGPAVLPAIAVGVVCAPLQLQLQLGNFGTLLAALLAGAWVADRRGWTGLAGTLVGIAAGLKLFPAFLLIYFTATRRWKAVAGFAVGFLGLNAIALGLFGVDAFRVYAIDIAPLIATENESSWMNASLVGFWMRLFGPTPSHGILPLAHAPEVGRALVVLSQVVVAVIVGWIAWRSRTPLARDRAFAVATAGMLLVGPLAWSHTFLLLLVPLGVLAVRLPAGGLRWVFLACLAAIWLPANYPAQMVIGAEQAQLMLGDQHTPLSPIMNLTIASVLTYALLGVFVLTLRLPKNPPDRQT